MTIPASAVPPTEDTAEAYRAAVLGHRQAFKSEREKRGSKKMNPHIPDHAAAEAVLRLSPGLTYDEAWSLAHQATSWAAQAHWHWFWKGVSPIAE
jgi:hypothetical protein